MFTLIPKYRSAEVLVQSSTQIFSSCYRDYCMTHHTPQGESDLHWPPKILSGKSLFTQSQNQSTVHSDVFISISSLILYCVSWFLLISLVLIQKIISCILMVHIIWSFFLQKSSPHSLPLGTEKGSANFESDTFL